MRLQQGFKKLKVLLEAQVKALRWEARSGLGLNGLLLKKATMTMSSENGLNGSTNVQ